MLLISAKIVAQTPAENIPIFNFFTKDKSAFTNSNLAQGKILFFVFFDATCDHCQHAVQYLNLHHEEFKQAAIYFITIDKPSIASSFFDKYGFNLKNKKNVKLLFDLNNEFILKFKPRKYPSLFLYSVQKKLLLYDDNEQNLPIFSKILNEKSK